MLFLFVTTSGVDFGKAFDIHASLEGSTFFAAVVLKVKHLFNLPVNIFIFR